MEYVLITGGSSGIGYALSEKFAADRYGILLAASNEKKLRAAKKRLEKKYQAKVQIYAVDLAEFGAAERLYKKIKADGFSVTVLVNNAGTGVIGAAETIEMKKEERMMVLNMITPVVLTKLFLCEMYQNGGGKILNVSSVGAFCPGPYTASYYAAKAFLLNYGRAVRFEAKRHNVSVCTVCPGTTKTGFFKRAEGSQSNQESGSTHFPPYAMSADRVASYAYKRLFQNKEISVPGWYNRLALLFPEKMRMSAVAAQKKAK